MILSPDTPAHPQPNEEVILPAGEFAAGDMDLNPELDDDTENESQPQSQEIGTSSGILDSTSNGIREISSRKDSMFALWTQPFDEALEQLRLLKMTQHQDQLSLSQQSKLVTFIDDRLLQAQRDFIKNQALSKETYSLKQLLADIAAVVDLVWRLVDVNAPLFGQEEYLIRIMGDLEDWVLYYDLPVLDADRPETIELHAALFRFFQAIDTRVSFLIDGYTAELKTYKLSGTELVRLMPIVSRVRSEMVNLLEKSCVGLLQKSVFENSSNTYMNILEIEVGRLLEGVIERL